MLLDYLSGTAAACQRGEWSSAAARSGVWHKAGEVVVVLVAACADLLLGLVLDNLAKLLQIGLDAVDGAGEQAGAGTDDKTE